MPRASNIHRSNTNKNANSTTLIGSAKPIHSMKLNRRPTRSSIMPTAIRFGGVPTGVAMPPMLHE